MQRERASPPSWPHGIAQMASICLAACVAMMQPTDTEQSDHVAVYQPRINAAALGRVLVDRASRCASLGPGPSCPGPRGAFGVSCYQEEGVPPHSWCPPACKCTCRRMGHSADEALRPRTPRRRGSLTS